MIGDYAFYDCSNLTSVTIPDSITSIGENVFGECYSLKAFYGELASSDNRCLIVNGILESFAPKGLTTYTIPDSVTSIGNYAFFRTPLTSVTIPNSVTSIGEGAFYSASLKNAIIPNSVTEIEMYAFCGCESLASVTISDRVTEIGDYAFYYCRSLKSVTIPDSVTSIGEDAFCECSSLVSIYCKPTTPPTGGVEMFSHYHDNEYKPIGCTIYVPRNSVSAYKSAEYWSDYKSYIVGYDF